MSVYVWRDPKRWRAVPGCLSGPECGLCMTRIRQTTPISPAEWKIIDDREKRIDARKALGKYQRSDAETAKPRLVSWLEVA